MKKDSIKKITQLVTNIFLIFVIFQANSIFALTIPDTVIENRNTQSNLPLEHVVIPGQTKLGFCDTGPNKSSEWNLSTGNVETDICNDVDKKSYICPEADMSYDNINGNGQPSVAVCYTKSGQKVRMYVDSSKMSFGGCNIHRDQAHLNEPGGYGAVYTWTSGGSNLFYTNRSLFSLGNMNEVRLQASTEVKSYKTTPCPPDSPVDPVYQNKDPNALGTLSYALSEVDDNGKLLGSYFVTFTVFNTLPDKATTQPSINCSFGNYSSVAVINAAFNIISLPGAKYTEIGSPQNYDVNILDAFKTTLTTCKSDPNFKGNRNLNLNNVYLTLVFNSMEVWNGSALDYSISNYKTVLKYKTDPKILPFGVAPTTISECKNIDGWAWDPAKPAERVFVRFYDGPNLISSTVTNINRGDVNAVTGGSGPTGYSYRVPAKYRDGVEREIGAYVIGSGGNYLSNTVPIKYKCNCPLKNDIQEKYDINGNCKFSLEDLSIFLNDYDKWKKATSPTCNDYEIKSDINGNCNVNLDDLSIFLARYNTFVKSGS